VSDAPTAAELRRRDDAVSLAAQTVFERPVVVEAGAGTGKTTLLVNRCLAWILGRGWEAARARLGADDPDRIAPEVLSRIAAITFTEAAAAEMAKRLSQSLAAVARGEQPDGFASDALAVGETLRAPRARALIGALDRWIVRTIHAFCRRLLAQHAFAAGLHPEFEVDADAREADAVARAVVEAALREGYGEPGNPDLIALGVEGCGPAEIEAALVALLDAAAPPAALAQERFTPEVRARLCDMLGRALTEFAAADAGRLARVNKRSTTTLGVVEALDETAGALARHARDESGFDALVAELRTRWSASLRERLSLWCAESGFNASERNAVGDAAASIAAAAGPLCAALEHLLELEPLRFERARRVLHPLLAGARERLRVRGALGYSALLGETRDLLRSRPELCARVRGELDQLLVDEFQDTDPVQCDIVRLLALTGAPEQRPGLFLVGDPKQSIYGWRAADLRAYTALVRDALGAGVEPLRLCVNRRSTPPILNEVERVLAPAMAAGGSDQAAFQHLVPSPKREREEQPFASGRCAVEHWISWLWEPGASEPRLPLAREAARLEAQAVAADLAALRRDTGLAWADAGLLLRGWSDLEVYLEALRAAGIPYAVEGGRSYYRRREVIDASALVRCVLDPNDHLALLTWLRSPSVGVPDAALIPLWTRAFPRLVGELAGPEPAALAALARAVDEACAELPEDVPGLDRIADWPRSLTFALAGIAALRESFERDPVDVFVEKLRAASLIEISEAARFPGAFRLANLERFFRELREELVSEASDPQALLRRLRADVADERAGADARPPDGGEDAVRVLTIHGAKGLEFRHCYVLQLHKGRGGASGASDDTDAREHDGRWECRLLGARSPDYAGVEARRLATASAERVRALYVATTRARDRLVLLGARALEGRGMRGARESLEELLATRSGVTPELADEAREARAAGRDGRIDADGVRWSFPALRETLAPAPPPPAPADAAAEHAELDARRLAAHARDAEQRMARAYRGRASADSHADAREQAAQRSFGSPAETAPRAGAAPASDAARLAGTEVHRVLETLRLDSDLRAQIAAQRERLASALAGDVLARFAQGPLLARLAALREHVIARELPVLLPPEPEGDGAVGFVAGAIDLLYRDPATGEFVVVDYKTDRVEGAAALAERAAGYRSQLASYRRAVMEALALARPPRGELWFLHAGEVVALA